MIITISREFGSGGRELGKRLSETLGIPCYDYEVIEMIGKEHGFNKKYIRCLTESSIQSAYQLTAGNRLMMPSRATSLAMRASAQLRTIIEELAKQGDCIIVGCCADVILKEYRPFKIFVYADEDAKFQRCMEHSSPDENLTEMEMKRKMREINRKREKQRKLYTDTKWGAKENYHLCINTSNIEIKTIIPVLAEYISIVTTKPSDK